MVERTSRRSVHEVFFCVGSAVLHLGGVLVLLGAWSLARWGSPDANIGGGIALMFGTALFAIGLLLELTALVVRTRHER